MVASVMTDGDSHLKSASSLYQKTPDCGRQCESPGQARARFHVNFQGGSAQVPQPDIAFHFNPRFDEGGCVVWNSFERGSWQHEKRLSSMPFLKGQPFDIRFSVKSSSYMVVMKGCSR
ncbi:UNVERIFIED_CONTAM: hypothetical protein K2H54_039427 [Gekko kuhli]